MNNVTPRYVSGIRPTGEIHLGNYLGAVRRWRSLEGVFFVADLHGLGGAVQETAESLSRCGVQNVVVESDHKADILELYHQLSFLTPTVLLGRMTQFKDKSASEMATLSLFAYPVLMAADIFYFGGTHIPVGSDQMQHIEFARDLWDVLRARGSTSFEKPEAVIGDSPRIMSLTDATRKMSKSDPDEMSRINVSDPPDVIRQKVRAAKTSMSMADDTPEANNLRTIYRAVGGTRVHERWPTFKAELVDLLIVELAA
ncbi:tryptophan--tRNA ligase [Limnoglobus roseus]|uniref:tryptophan--tRNA ligase n=1 Tax=Limnoglobus roseus TaxID=2598579 RepID=A0A5C1A948_9BACT|nr:tryptophan--tRNA ligase [Limnoglobus roseus]QEL14733.1 tryptophan--tRNA ligase [Limnoglobus roseus]